jgi:outer membrane protein assembly factor BamD (BamD/ComL family)
MNRSTQSLRPGLCPGLFLGLVLAIASLAATTPSASAADKPKEQQISRVIAKEMTAAQKALQASQWQEALKNLEAAEQKSPLTPFDKKTIYDFKGFANVRLNKMKEAQQDYEQALATGQYTAEDAAKTTRMLFRLAAQNQQLSKALDYGKQVADAGSANPDDLAVMSQIYYLQKDCKNSAVWADKAISAARKAGETPKENLFQFKLQCASDAGDNQAMAAVLLDLIKLTNKTNYWNTLLRIERQDERDDHNLLMIYRVMYDTNSMNAGSDYMEMAQLLGDAALPGEASAVLDKAMSSSLFTEQKDKDRATRLANSLKPRAESDKKGEAAFDAEAAKNPAGELDVKSGEVYYGSGDYQNAVTAITRGIEKKGIKHLDEAYVYLGRAQVALKNTAEAKKAFSGLKSVPNMSPRVLKLWELYSDKLGS